MNSERTPMMRKGKAHAPKPPGNPTRQAREVALMIDAASSRDLDDAFTLRPTKGGGWYAQIFIAAAADLIAPGGAADTRARQRIQSKYLPRTTIPMLGPDIEQAGTLSDTQERMALAIAIDFDPAGICRNIQVSRTVLPPGRCLRVCYEQVPEALEDPHHDLHEQLLAAHNLSQTLLASRRASGALTLYDLTQGIEITEDGTVARIPRQKRTVGYIIVQELMIAANEALATWCIDQGLAVLFRNHRTNLVSTGGADLAADIAASMHDPKLFAQLQDRVHRTYGKAEYARIPRGHHGLSLMAYTHATSPLRRYADLVTQRIILAHLDGAPHPYSAAQLDSIAEHLNTELQAQRQRKHQHFKEQGIKAAIADILDGDFTRLNPKQWRRVFDLVTQAEPVPGIEAELIRRLDEGILGANDFIRVAAAEGTGWRQIQRRIYPKVRARHPEFAPSILSGWRQITREPAIELDEAQDPDSPPHNPRFAARARAGRQTGAWQVANSKKAAQAQAMWELIYVLGGHAPSVPNEDLVWPAVTALPAGPQPEPGPVAACAPGQLSDQTLRHLAAVTPTKRARATDNPVSWLTSLAERHHLGRVDYVYSTHGPQHTATFICTASLAGQTTTRSATNKNQARVAASLALVQHLFTTADAECAPAAEHGRQERAVP
ncbi:RNB domain-containing ribonuclease [Mycobacteroides abscessus]|uniref:RNB domain-containing ribonuclease n=1 Tax=Mycobacteroides abscessus TaxID=36809 RepID=UPI000C25D7BC|nr:RNB domain-containing ribonuclease [Mycobacteroides abscessus]